MAFGDAKTKGFGNASQIFANILNLIGSNAKIVGPNFIFNNKGLFLYSGAPATGNLVESITPAAGSDDGHGNPFDAGFTSYQAGTGVFAELLAGILTFGKTGSGFASNPNAGTDSGGQQLILNSASNTINNGTEIALDLNNVLIQKQAGGPADPLLTILGNIGVNGKIETLLAGIPETEHAFSFTAAGWAQAAGRPTCQYLLQPLGQILVMGSVVVPAGFVPGQAITNAAAAGYRPVHGQSLIGADITGNTAVRLFWTAGGVLQFSNTLSPTAVAAGDTIDIPPQTVYLNN